MNNLKSKCLNGCLAEGTILTMADGSKQRIEEVKIGDMVAVPDARAKRIVDIYTGYEEKISELKLVNGIILKATSNHPIMTEKGHKRLKELNPLDKVVIRENQLESIEIIAEVEADTRVYNVLLEEMSTIICNDIWVGDFQVQNNLESTRYRNNERINEIETEMKKLMDELEKLKG